MKYFNGFSLYNEEKFFEEYIVDTKYSVVGFSYGTQRAFEYVYNNKEERIDRLILLSPAFFQNQKKSFIKTQLLYFNKSPKVYIDNFIKNLIYPNTDIKDIEKYIKIGTKRELKELLTYIWDIDKLKELIDRNIIIEVFIGEKDKIVNAKESFLFFSQITTTYLIKNVGHLLK
jgi:pimeloyl-ACP methyl ester carboxylesterase